MNLSIGPRPVISRVSYNRQPAPSFKQLDGIIEELDFDSTTNPKDKEILDAVKSSDLLMNKFHQKFRCLIKLQRVKDIPDAYSDDVFESAGISMRLKLLDEKEARKHKKQIVTIHFAQPEYGKPNEPTIIDQINNFTEKQLYDEFIKALGDKKWYDVFLEILRDA